jgi:hypothetical protein
MIFRQLLNINKAHIKIDDLLNTLNFVHKMLADIVKLVCSSVELAHKMTTL